MSDLITENATRFLDSLRRPDLAALISRSKITIGTTGRELVVIVQAPQPFAEAIQMLPQNDRQRIAEAAVSQQSHGRSPDDIIVKNIGEPVDDYGVLLPDLLIHREMMIAVSTGSKQIQDVDDYYGARQVRIIEVCAAAGIPYTNPHASLWDWYRHWKEHFGSYVERRNYIRKLFAGPIAAATARISNRSLVAEREPTGWERVDRVLARARTQLQNASSEEGWQTVGLLCREILISLGQAVYDPAIHTTEDGVVPSATDANRLIEAYVRHVFPGEGYKEVRALSRAALALALNLQHRRTATRRQALLCLEGTASAVRIVSIAAEL